MRVIQNCLSSISIVLLLLTRHINFAHASKSPQQCQDPSILDLFNLQSKPGDQRHDLERERVLHEIDRRHGRWNNKHPRWSILEALHGYDRYREIAGAEIDRFEGLYKHVAKEHKKVVFTCIPA